MDIELAKTFLEIMSLGSFLKASEHMNVTQTAVTARIGKLEEILGCKLFIRNRSGTKLTPDGEKFVEHALTLVKTWERAKSELSSVSEKYSRFSIGGESSLWNPVLVNWCIWIQRHMPNIVLNTEVSGTHDLITRLAKGDLDVIIVHRPNYHSQFVVEQIMEEKLVHVQSCTNPETNLYIDWGDEFKRQYDKALPQPRQNAYTYNLGPLALRVILENGGNCYFRTRVVQSYIDNGQLERVPNTPEFTYPIFVMFRKDQSHEMLESALEGLRRHVNKDFAWSV